MYKEEKN